MPDTALLVIDLQRGAFDGVRCAPVDRPQRLIDNALQLIGAARAGGTPVVFVQHCEGPGEPFEEGSPHGELHEALAPRPGEPVVRKHASSAFEGTDLATVLAQAGVRQLVLCGLQSEFCVSNTAKAALALGYPVRVADDGHSTWPSNGESAPDIAERANRLLASAGALPEPTAALAGMLRQADA